jgi:hypothetical protein
VVVDGGYGSVDQSGFVYYIHGGGGGIIRCFIAFRSILFRVMLIVSSNVGRSQFPGVCLLLELLDLFLKDFA